MNTWTTTPGVIPTCGYCVSVALVPGTPAGLVDTGAPKYEEPVTHLVSQDYQSLKRPAVSQDC